jgi:hypothetical protein
VKKDNIEELVKNAFEQFEPEVPAHLWDNIQAQISPNPPASQAPAADGGVSAGSGFTSGSAFLKIAAAALVITGGAYIAYNLFTNSPDNDSIVEVPTHQTTQVEVENQKVAVDESTVSAEDNSVNQHAAPTQIEGDNTSNNDSENDSELTNVEIIDLEQSSEESNEVVNEAQQNVANPAQSGVSSTGKTQPSKATQSNTSGKKPNSEVINPVEAGILADKVSGEVPLRIKFQNISAAQSFEWDFGNGVKSFEAAPTITFEEDGDYTVKLIVTNFEGKQLEDRMEISAYLPSTLFAPDVITPNGDGLNDFFEVKGENVSNVVFKIFRAQGSVVFEGKSIFDKWDGVDSQNPEGINYMLQVTAIGSDGKPMKPINKHLTVIRD